MVFSTDRTDALAYKYATFFEQSDKMLRIAAANFDKDGNVLEASSIITTAKYNRLISVYFDENGELRNKSGLVTTANFSKLFAEGVTSNGLVKKAELNVYVTKDEFGDLVSGVTIKADQIKLEGLVTANSYFKVLTDGSIETRNANISGTVKADKGKIGGFTIDSGRLYWKSRDYFGNDSRSLKLGVSSSSTEGIVDVAFNGATSGRFGVKSVGATSGGAAIYASIGSLTYPASSMAYAGFFVGPVDVRDTGNGLISDVCASKGFRYIQSRNSDGTYVYNEGVNWGGGMSENPDLDKIRLIVRGGIIVGYNKE